MLVVCGGCCWWCLDCCLSHYHHHHIQWDWLNGPGWQKQRKLFVVAKGDKYKEEYLFTNTFKGYVGILPLYYPLDCNLREEYKKTRVDRFVVGQFIHRGQHGNCSQVFCVELSFFRQRQT